MTYSFQTFSLNQVLTASQMNQVEANIRDHIHGASGVLTGNTHVRAWANADVAGAIQASYGVSSVTDGGAGIIEANWATNFTSADYVSVGYIRHAFSAAMVHGVDPTNLTVGVTRFRSTNTANTNTDPVRWHLTAFGDQ